MATETLRAGGDESLPDRIPVLPVRSTVLFPLSATALQIAWEPNVEALAAFPEEDLLVAVVAAQEEAAMIEPSVLQKVAVAARVLDRLYLPGGVIQITLQGRRRVHLREVRFEDGHYTATPEAAEESPAGEIEAERLIELILTTVGGVAAKVERIPDEVPRILRNNVADPGRFADLVAALCHFNVPDRDEVLQTLDVTDRLDLVLGKLQETWEQIREIEQEHQLAEGAAGAAGEARPALRRNRPVELRNRIRALQAELGEIDPAEREAVEMLRRISRAQLPARVAARARLEADRLRDLATTKTEAAEIRAFLEALLTVPWTRTSDGGPVDLEAVRRAMDEEHLGVEEAKRRVLEVLSVAKLRGSVPAPILCLVGPPDVGKASLAAAVARGLGRPLASVELRGRNEAQLVGSRRTRSGAQPGKLVGALSEAAVRDPVFLLEDVDEVGLGNPEGDPIEALEEFIGPESRASFVDRYLDAPLDLSDVLFIATAQDFFRIPLALRDYFIEVRIAGYTPEEKVEIARERLLPMLTEEHGVALVELTVSDETLLHLTRGYARDAGLGQLRRGLAAILRSVAHEKATRAAEHWTLDEEMIQEVLGAPRYMSTAAESAPEVGVVTGLAWTASGGELMFIEALRMPGSGRLIITGMLGDVMRESVNAAYSYVRSRAAELGIAADAFDRFDVHVHFPVGSIPKDGPSAGGAVTLAIASALAERPVRHDLAMTGEVTLRGRIMEIGGVREKILAANRAGVRHIILPAVNERDLRDVPEEVREGMLFHFVERMDEIFELALLERGSLHALPRQGAAPGATAERGPRAAAEG